MRNKKAKQLRKDVMLKLYVGDGVTEKDVRKGKHDCMKEPEFKRIFRARKRNESAPVEVVPNHMLTVDKPDPTLKFRWNHRMWKAEMRRRKR